MSTEYEVCVDGKPRSIYPTVVEAWDGALERWNAGAKRVEVRRIDAGGKTLLRLWSFSYCPICSACLYFDAAFDLACPEHGKVKEMKESVPAPRPLLGVKPPPIPQPLPEPEPLKEKRRCFGDGSFGDPLCHDCPERLGCMRVSPPAVSAPPTAGNPIGLSFAAYQKEVVATRIYPDRGTVGNIFYAALGLGEAGEVQNKVKKIVRDDGGELTEERRQAILKECGDTLWYLADLVDHCGSSLQEVALRNLLMLRERKKQDKLRGDGDNREEEAFRCSCGGSFVSAAALRLHLIHNSTHKKARPDEGGTT